MDTGSENGQNMKKTLSHVAFLTSYLDGKVCCYLGHGLLVLVPPDLALHHALEVWVGEEVRDGGVLRGGGQHALAAAGEGAGDGQAAGHVVNNIEIAGSGLLGRGWGGEGLNAEAVVSEEAKVGLLYEEAGAGENGSWDLVKVNYDFFQLDVLCVAGRALHRVTIVIVLSTSQIILILQSDDSVIIGLVEENIKCLLLQINFK